MPDDKNNADDVFVEEDLTADFLNPRPSDKTSDDTKPSQSSKSKDGGKTGSTTPSKQQADAPKSETGEWMEKTKKDLPGQLDLDIYETNRNLVVLCRIAGADQSKIDVQLSEDNILSIKGVFSCSIQGKGRS